MCLATEGVPSPKKSKKRLDTRTDLVFWLNLFDTELSQKQYWWGQRSQGSDDSHFNVSLTVRDKVTRQCLETTTFEERGELKQSQIEVLLLTSLMPYY